MTTSIQFWHYAQEAMNDARRSNNEIEKQMLLDLVQVWTQAAVWNEGVRGGRASGMIDNVHRRNNNNPDALAAGTVYH